MTAHLRRFISAILTFAHLHPLRFGVQVGATLLVVFGFVVERSFWTPDTLFLLLLVLALAFGRMRDFLVRFVPFLGLLLVYDSFRSIADDLNGSVHFTEMINFDRFVFGGILPTQWLQDMWWHGQVSWYDFYFYFFYTLHFLAPVLVAILIWLRRGKLYWPYMWGFLLLSFGGFLTYVLFPAAPPWMASDLGYIPQIHRISSDVWQAMDVTNFSEIYGQLSPNEVAAVPSLHAAYPTLLVLFVARAFGWRRTWWLVFYPISVWVGIVYLGEHYVFDALLGILYAYAAYLVSMHMFGWSWNGGYARLRQGQSWRRGFAVGQSVRRKFF